MKFDASIKAVSFTISTNNHALSFYRPEDSEQILNQLTDEEFNKDECMPYWAEHWPVSDALIDFLLTTDKIPVNSRIVELGCGLGTVSATLSYRGLHSIATDISLQACHFSQLNISQFQNPSIVCCDWRHSPFKHPADVIIGSDILYEKRWVDSIAEFCSTHLIKNGIAIFADPQRPYWTLFKDAMRNANFSMQNREIIKSKNKLSTYEIIFFRKE